VAASDPSLARSARGARSGALLLPIACLLVIAVLAWQVLSAGPVTVLDAQVTQWLAANRQPWLNAFMLAVANGHDTVRLLVATVLIAFWRIWRQQQKDLAYLAAVPAGMLLNVGLKNVFARPRPVLEDPLVHLSTFSFPSGHAVASTVFYGAVCALVLAHARSRGTRAMAVAAAVLMVLLVCFSRVYLGAHYLSDVLAGVCVGTLCLLPFLRLARRARAATADGVEARR